MPKGNGKEAMVVERFYVPHQLQTAIEGMAERRGLSKSELYRAVMWQAVERDFDIHGRTDTIVVHRLPADQLIDV